MHEAQQEDSLFVRFVDQPDWLQSEDSTTVIVSSRPIRLHSGQALSGFTVEEGVTEQIFKPDRSFTGDSTMDETMTKAEDSSKRVSNSLYIFSQRSGTSTYWRGTSSYLAMSVRWKT